MTRLHPIANGLIVDDDIRAHEILTDGLDEFQFDSAYEIDDSKKLLNDNKYAFVLLDYRLGINQNGLSLVDHIRSTNPIAAIILMSAYGTTFVLRDAIEKSIDTYLDKPIILEEYKHKLTSTLTKRGLTHSINFAESVSTIEQTIQTKGDNISDLTLQDYAKQTNKSYKYLSQKFKKETGKTFQQLKKEEKYATVKKLLTNTNLPIKEISKQCGFKNPSAIMRGFKDFTGQTMTEYRNKTK